MTCTVILEFEMVLQIPLFFLHLAIAKNLKISTQKTVFCRTATLLPFVTQQQNVIEYWWDVQPLLSFYQHLFLLLWASVVI